MILIALKRLRSVANPMLTPPWEGAADLRPRHVRAALLGKPMIDCSDVVRGHAQRIADLMVSGWTKPIWIDVGIPSFQCRPRWIIQDGNHRVYAGLMLGNEHIGAQIDGCIKTAKSMLGADIDMVK